jgi:hypothetical protein
LENPPTLVLFVIFSPLPILYYTGRKKERKKEEKE